MKPARTRFAPSPTGFLHVGGVRTALFAWLLARHSNGQFILRLEDTDKNREVEGSVQHIMDSLRWLGLQWDEGLDADGAYGPYRQSDRLEIYKDWARKLVKQGKAYADPYTPEQVEQFRQEARVQKRPFLYRDHRPANPPKWDPDPREGEPMLPLRFKSNPKPYQWHDEVMGNLSSGPESIDDFVILKADGYPTYNFAHIIDDHLMYCTHVIRSQEFLASVPKYLNLYEALGLGRPLLVTVPYVMGPDGKKKLSKRDGAKDILDYAREGYLPETLLNFTATLGWNDGSEQEFFSAYDLIKKFDISHINKGGARFDEQRLLWMNGHYIRQMEPERLRAYARSFWPAEANGYSDDYRQQVLVLVQERLKYFAELPQLTMFFFKDLPVDMELISTHKQLKKISAGDLRGWLQMARGMMEQSNFTVEDLTNQFNNLLTQTEQKPGVLFSLIRIATTQAPASPGLAETIAVLGKGVALRRIDATLKELKD